MNVILLMALLCYACLLLNRREIHIEIIYELIQRLAIYYFLATVFFIFNAIRYEAGNFIGRFLLILPLFIIIFGIDSDAFLDLLEKICCIMFFLSAISLFFWVFGTQFHILAPTGTVKFSWGLTNHEVRSYLFLYIETQKEWFFGRIITRNSGCFVETPPYMFCLMIAILAELFLIQGKKMHLIILYMALFSTISTTGIITGVLALVCWIFSHRNELGDRFLGIIWTLGMVAMGIGIYIAWNVYRQKSGSGSWHNRLYQFRTTFQILKSHFLFGSGYNGGLTISDFDRNEENLFAAFGMTAAQGGLVLLSMHFMPFLLVWKNAINNHGYMNLVYFSLVILFILLTTPVVYQPILLMIIAYYWTEGVKVSKREVFYVK